MWSFLKGEMNILMAHDQEWEQELSPYCRNLPFGERATRGSRVRLPREENAQSCHQRLFEENVEKTRKVWSTNFNRERFGSCFIMQGEGISTAHVHHKGR